MEVYSLLVNWERLELEWKPEGAEPIWSEFVEQKDAWVESPKTAPSDSAYENSEIGEAFWGSISEKIPMLRVVEIAGNVIDDSGAELDGGESFQQFIGEWTSVLREAKELNYGVLV